MMNVLLMVFSYVINSEAMKKIYKTMKNRPNDTNQPKDLGREWHSDSECLLEYEPTLNDLLTPKQASSKTAPQISPSSACKTPHPPGVIPSGAPAMSCTTACHLPSAPTWKL